MTAATATAAAAASAGAGPRCRVCGSDDVERLGPPAHIQPTRVAGVPIDISDLRLDFCRCRACGYAFIDPIIPEDRLIDCYRRSAGGHWTTDESIAEARFYPRKRELLTQFAPGRRVLDFGCYDGGFLAYLGPGFERAGIEPSHSAARRAGERGVQILGPTLDAIEPAKAAAPAVPAFDAVVVFDVMEHLADPVTTLSKLAAMLPPGGIVLIETGNTDAPAFRRRGPLYLYTAVVEHVGFFNESSIREAARRAGLELVHFEISQHTAYAPCSPLKAAMVNSIYWVLRGLHRARVPLPTRLRHIAAGPVPRVTDLRDHFLAVLKRPGV